jgi:trigger factor
MAQTAQVQEVSNKGLKREFVIKVPQDIVAKKLTKKLEEIGKTAKQSGFRPGKVPMDLIRKQYAPSARAEILDQAVSDATEETLTERKLRPAMQPKIELVSFAEDKDLEFKLEVEVLPEVTPADFSKISLERLAADVEDKTIEEAIGRAAKSMREPETVTEARPAKLGDILVIDFDGSVDGKAQPGMKGDGHSLELGSKSFIDTFEEQLVGSKVGDKKTIKVKFPENYHAANLSGKEAEFKVEVKELRAPKPLEMNEALAKDLGFPSLEKLKERVKDDISADYQRIIRAIIKRQLMDKLAEMHKFEVPAGMLENEFSSIWQQIELSKNKGELPEADKKKSDDELKKEYREIAERRIRLGLLLAEVAQKQKIGVEPAEMRNALMAEARRFPGQEKAAIDYYTKTEGALERIRAPLLEEKVVDHILGQAKISEKKITADELLKLPEEMD